MFLFKIQQLFSLCSSMTFTIPPWLCVSTVGMCKMTGVVTKCPHSFVVSTTYHCYEIVPVSFEIMFLSDSADCVIQKHLVFILPRSWPRVSADCAVHSFTSGVAGLKNFTPALQNHVPHHQKVFTVALNVMIRWTHKHTKGPLVCSVWGQKKYNAVMKDFRKLLC